MRQRRRPRAAVAAASLLNAATLVIAGACSDATTALSPAGTSVTKPPPSAPPVPSFVPQLAFVSTRDGSPYIYLASAAGDSVIRFAQGENPAWAWNGRELAFDRATTDGKGPELHVMTVDGNSDSVLPVSGSEPWWSWDGKSLLFVAAGGIYSSDAIGNAVTLLVPSGFVEPGDQLHSPSWSPSSDFMVFTRVDTAEQSDIYIAGGDGSNPRRLVAGDSPRWSPDATTISFDLPQGGLATVNVGGSNLQMRDADGSGAQIRNGDWSPDGTNLVFSKGAAPSGLRIFIFSLGSNVAAQLIPNAGPSASPNYADYGAVWLRVASPWDY